MSKHIANAIIVTSLCMNLIILISRIIMESKILHPSIRAVVFNVICLVSLLLIVILFSKVGKPYHRGFFCDDKAISKPFKKGTVSSVVAAVVGLLLPIICILVIEIPRFRNTRGQSKPFYKTRWFRWLVLVITFFAVGAGGTTVLTDVGKYTIGRLRPHFLDVCKPNFLKLNCSTGFEKHFITGDVCTGVDKALIREARLSFPSGHASFSAYCMMFLVFYIDIRMSFCSSLRLFKPFLQFIFLLLALLCGMSRVSDYKHHWSDVVAGLILGTLIAIFIIYKVLHLNNIAMNSSLELGAIQRESDPEKGQTSATALS